MQAWQRLDDGTNQTKSGFRTVVHKQFQMNNGRIMHADILGSQDSAAAAVIALTDDNRVIIARQFRCGPEKVLDEIPGGIVDDGETPEQAAKRELEEEVGYRAENLEFLGSAYVNAWDNTIHHYYLARQCSKMESANLEADEEIEVLTLSISEFIDNAMQARMTDSQAVLLAYDTLKDIEGGVK